MTTSKSPAFQWYPKDILASVRVAEMSLEEEGAYRRALDFCWLAGDLPAEPERLARVIGKECTPATALKISEMFVEKNGRLFHENLERERKKQKEYRSAKSRAGKASAEKRRQTKELDDQQVLNCVDDMLPTEAQRNSTLLSSSSSSFPTSDKEGISLRSLPVNQGADEELKKWIAGIKTVYGTKHLPSLRRWETGVIHAIENEIPLEEYTNALTTLLADDTRKFPVSPDNVMTHVLQARVKGNGKETYEQRIFREAAEYRAAGLQGGSIENSEAVAGDGEPAAAS